MNKQDFINRARKIPSSVKADIPGFGQVVIRILSPQQRIEEYTEWLRPNGKLNKARAEYREEKLVSICLIDEETGEPIFSDVQEFAGIIRETPGLWNQLFPAVMKANKFTEEAEATFEKKSDELPPARNGSYTSASGLPSDEPILTS